MPRFTWLRAALAAVALAATSLSAQAQLATAEHDTLQALYNATNGAGWTTNTNWMNGGDPCSAPTWFGVMCSGDGQHVTELHLSANQLDGSLPDLSALTSLVRLNLESNQLTGPLTTIASLPALQGFWGTNNQFSGYLPNLPALTALQIFHVNNNQLSGPIPDISGMTSLIDFRVSTNRLTGSPPAAPAGLAAGGSSLCPNFLTSSPGNDAQWSAATGELDWTRYCETGYLVTATIGTGGTTNPTPGVGVRAGETAAFTITLEPGFTLGPITSTCGGALAGNVFTTDAVRADCAVQISMIAPPTAAVPALGTWSLMLLGALAAGLGLRRVRRNTL